MSSRRGLLLFFAASLLLALPVRADWPQFDGRRGASEPPASPQTPAVGPDLEMNDRLWVVIRAASPQDRSKAAALGLDIVDISGANASGVATPAGLARLQEAGFEVIKQTALRNLPRAFPPQDKAYHDYAQVQATLAQIAGAHKDFASIVEVGQSVRGRKITALRFNTTAQGGAAGKKPGALFVGNHHAREHLSTEVPLLAAQWIADNAAKPEVRKLLDTRDIYFLPLLNPDGAEYDIETGQYRWQRKNMRANPDGSTGVDLNRNFDSHWRESGTSTHPSDDTYGGPSAFSEPESRALKAFLDGHANIKTMISYHSYAELVLYPWGWGEEQIPGKPLLAFKAMAAKMAGWTGYTAEQSSDLYPASGDSCDWAWAEHGVYCFTIELTGSGGGFYPGSAAIAPSVSKNVPAILYLIDLADDPLRAAGNAAL
ncbi:MAG: M14 family metallopeptidase [Elusimicrobia bacterium]|nr:M14 family metallopeptidase [Elusimicrobiota bacterium]